MTRAWYAEYAAKYEHQLVIDGRLVSVRQAMQILDKPRTTVQRFMKWFADWHFQQGVMRDMERERAEREYDELLDQEVEKPKSAAARISDRTWTDERSGTVFTDLGPDYGLISFTQGEFRSIRRDYSKHYGGKAATRQDIAIRYRFPTIHAFEEFAKIHELRQNTIPFTDEELEEEGVEALVDKSIESKRQKFMLDLSAKEMEQQKRDAERWRAFQVNAELIARSVNPILTPMEPVAPAEEVQPHALMISLTDLHLGKASYSHDGKLVYDRKEAARRALAAVQNLLQQALLQGYPEEIMLLIASDGVHADLPLMTTSSGTSLAGQTDGTYREMIEEYLRLVQRLVSLCVKIAPVRLLCVEGNHDRVTSMMIGLLLQHFYSEQQNVTVERQMNDGLIFVNYGENSLGMTHGDGLRQHEALKIMLNAAEERGLPLKRYRNFFLGHYHHEATKDLGGVKVHVLTSLSPADEWHRRNHFTGSLEEAQAFVFRRSGGKAAVFYSHPDCLTTV